MREAASIPTIMVAIFDDHELFRVGAQLTLMEESRLNVIHVSPINTTIHELKRIDQCVMVVGDGPNVEAIVRKIHAAPTSRQLVFLTDCVDSRRLGDLLRLDFSGVVCRSGPKIDLVRAVLAASEGRKFVSPEFSEPLIETLATSPKHALPPHPPVEAGLLTSREREVLALVCRGMANQEIAHALHIGEKTVKFHVSNILSKSGLRTRAQLIVSMATA